MILRRLFFWTSFLVCVFACARADEVSWDDFFEKSRAQLLEQKPARAAFALVVGSRSFSSPRTDEPFEMGELLQPLTSLLAAKLEQDGAVAWDKPLVTRHAFFGLAGDEAAKRCTLRDLLGMTAGIPVSADEVLKKLENPNAQDAFEIIKQLKGPPVGAARVESRVSFLAGAYALLKDPLAKNTPEQFAALMQTQLLEPLGISAKLALSVASCSLKMSAQDAFSWLYAEANRGRSVQGKQIVQPSLVLERYKAVPVKGDQAFGLGWQRDDYEGLEMISRLWIDKNRCAMIGVFPRYRAGMLVLIEGANEDTPLSVQDIFLNMADLLRETPLPPPND